MGNQFGMNNSPNIIKPNPTAVSNAFQFKIVKYDAGAAKPAAATYDGPAAPKDNIQMGLMDQQKYVQDHNDNRDIDMDELHELLGS